MKIMFVCTGNICRSPAAEAVAKHLVDSSNYKHKIEIYSAGLQSHHVGQEADIRTQESGKARGLKFDGLAQLFLESNFFTMDWIIAMDRGHYNRLISLTRGKKIRAKIVEIISYCEDTKFKGIDGIPDPYYGTKSDFEKVLDLLELGVKNFLENEIYPKLKSREEI